MRYWISEHDLQTPIKARHGQRDEALAAGQRTISAACAAHGETDHIIENSGRVRCKACRQERVSDWRRRTKLRLIAEAGGACVICGYDRCPAALEFHHLDPAMKSFWLSAKGRARSLDRLREEAAKCALLCANCHAELEAGYTRLPDSPEWTRTTTP